MKYKLLLINPQGTLTTSDGSLCPKSLKSLLEVQAKYGITLVVVGYSSLNELLPLSEKLQLKQYGGYLISPQEGELYNCHTEKKVAYKDANMVTFFMDKLDLLAEEIIAIGAHLVDAQMIQSAGLGVAMAQADEQLKSIAQYVTYSSDDGGVEHFVDKYIRNNTSGIPYTIEEINKMFANTLMARLGMTATIVAENYVEMTMPVDSWTAQPLGILHGGANLALAETAAGLGSMAIIGKDKTQVGTQVSGYHVGRAVVGDTMRAEARLLHGGKTTHVWSVEIYSVNTNKLIHTARVLNTILKLR